MNYRQAWTLLKGEGPLVAVALHDGHEVRPGVRRHMILSEGVRRREEDPFTAAWTEVAPTRVVGTRSRFEVDLNRARAEAVYLKPEDAWGLQVWRSELPEEEVRGSLAIYDAFYETMYELFQDLVRTYGCFVVYDLHSYNHRRNGPDAEAADVAGNPEVNIGTGTMDRAFWAPVVDRFIHDLRKYNCLGRHLDVRENVKFVGRGFPRFVHEHFPKTGCALAVEMKKFFMDEWTGALDARQHAAVKEALAATVPGVLHVLNRLRVGEPT
jgi:N-formylglutamate amidohydrolase